MILRKGLWSGRGSVLTEGASLGQSISLDAEIVDELDGLTITGEISDSYVARFLCALHQRGRHLCDRRALG